MFIDRQYRGTAPLTLSDVAPGPHRVNLSAEGYDGYAEDMEVISGPQTIVVRFKEIRLSVTLAVVHKHRLGECRGQLIATPDGLRYETAGDDAFVVPLGALETFDVDYLSNSLRLKQRGGRTYNFSDPHGNADTLFAFHRDVDKVRQRLAVRDAPGAR